MDNNCLMFTRGNTISKEGKLIIAAQNNMDELHRCNDHWKRPYIEEFILRDSIYLNTKQAVESKQCKYKSRQWILSWGQGHQWLDGNLRRTSVGLVTWVCSVVKIHWAVHRDEAIFFSICILWPKKKKEEQLVKRNKQKEKPGSLHQKSRFKVRSITVKKKKRKNPR